MSNVSTIKIKLARTFFGRLLAKPSKSITGRVADFTLGKKVGGTRKSVDMSTSGITKITKSEYNKLLKDPRQKAKAVILSGPGGRKTYGRRREVYGGLVGAARENPIPTAAIAGGAYLMSKPQYRPIITESAPGNRVAQRSNQMAPFHSVASQNKPWG